MGMTKVHVWHDLSGQIVAVGHSGGGAKCLPVPGEKQFVLEIEVEDSCISSLHRTHRIDPLRQVIVAIQSI